MVGTLPKRVTSPTCMGPPPTYKKALRSLLWFNWSCRRNYLHVEMSQGNFFHLEVFRVLRRPFLSHLKLLVSYPDEGGRTFEHMDQPYIL